MKELIWDAAIILALCLGLSLVANKLDSSAATSSKKILIIYNWGGYINPNLIAKFEKRTDYEVIYEAFNLNEAVYTKVRQGRTSYDLVIPSDHMITKMREGHLLDKVNTDELSNLRNINKQLLHQSFDKKNQYSVPYFWGILGTIHNGKYVKSGEIQHWDDLRDSKWKDSILLVDSARDTMGSSLVSLGYSMNTTNSVELELTKTKLDGLGANIRATISDGIRMYMIQNEAALAVTWSGEVSEMLSSNSHLHYVVPEEGSNSWLDNTMIPKTAESRKAAYAFINFMLDTKNAVQNAEYDGYATPSEAAMKYLPKSIRGDKQLCPNKSTIKHLQIYKDLPSKRVQEHNDLFLEFKMYSR